MKTKNKTSILFRTLIFLFASTISFAQPMRVLFIGNSYTHYNNMPNLFEQIAKSKGIKIEVYADAKSNHTFKMHAQRLELYNSIRSKKWDYVILQGFSRELAQDNNIIDSASLPYAKQILDSIYKRNPCTSVLLYQTWGYEDGFILDSTGNKWDYQTMSDRIHKGYIYLGKKLSLGIVPVGKTWEIIKENHPEIKLYQNDKQHPSIAGSYLAACCFYTAIFKTFPKVKFTSTLDTSAARIIQEVAGCNVLMNRNRYNINDNSVDVEVNITSSGNQEITCTANFKTAKSCTWDLGDGTVKQGFKFQHTYAKRKAYEITVTVIDACGERIIKRKVLP